MEYTKKVIVIGDMGVGKTSFVARVTEGRYLNEHKTTIGGLSGGATCCKQYWGLLLVGDTCSIIIGKLVLNVEFLRLQLTVP